MGRGKVEMKRIENPTSRQVTFSKRRNGLLKKAFELSILCDVEVALLIFSPTGRAYQFASHDMDRTIFRYRNEVGLVRSDDQQPGNRSTEFWRNEIDELKRTVDNMETKLKHMGGEDISTLGTKELKHLERQLKIGVERIRSRKRRIMSEQINTLKRKHKALQEENTRLQKTVKLHELNGPIIRSATLESNACNIFQHRIIGEGISGV